jgi:exodeoxyribonuclease-3
MSTLHLVNWNVNGIRSIIKKDFARHVRTMNADILCLQETKAADEDVKEVVALFPEYKSYINSSKARKGYSGTAILTKHEPVHITYDIGLEVHDQEGRVITAEFKDFFLVTVYVPNAGEGLARLAYREEWNRDFLWYLTWLDKRKPVVVGGDFNVAHQPIDIARARENYNKSAGYTQQEIDGFKELLNGGFTDTFRYFYPEKVKYTYWNYMFNARAKNVGWRIDYFLVSNRLLPNVEDAMIYNEFEGSDHCPVGLRLHI